MKKILIYLNSLFVILSCKEVDCNEVKQSFYPIEYNVVVRGSHIDLTWIKIVGSSLKNDGESDIMIHNNWILDSSNVEIGDTIIKRKGSLDLTIHKKDTIFLFNWHCRGKSYK